MRVVIVVKTVSRSVVAHAILCVITAVMMVGIALARAIVVIVMVDMLHDLLVARLSASIGCINQRCAAHARSLNAWSLNIRLRTLRLRLDDNLFVSRFSHNCRLLRAAYRGTSIASTTIARRLVTAWLASRLTAWIDDNNLRFLINDHRRLIIRDFRLAAMLVSKSLFGLLHNFVVELSSLDRLFLRVIQSLESFRVLRLANLNSFGAALLVDYFLFGRLRGLNYCRLLSQYL